ncbi:MAG: D-glycerate dehydrogenase [Phycisphaerales bacterium]|nr:D-glycerate dehydrogenase [Phycisphaerales bacterium]
MTMRVFITRPLPGDAVAMLEATLAARPEARSNWSIGSNPEDRALTPEALRRAVAGMHGVLSTPRDRIDAAVLDAAGPQLRIVSNYATGVDNIDLDRCRQRGILVGHTPDAVTEPTADIAWLLLLGAARRASEGDALVRGGNWTGVSPHELLGRRLVGRTLLVVGAGRIGAAVARRAVGWRMRILYAARRAHPEFEAPPLAATRVELDDGLRQADAVTLHTPLTAETHHLIDARRLALMKPSAVLVNTARGPIVDEAALVQALRSHQILAAGLDVFEEEPRVHPGLRELPNVFLLPHLGSATVEDRTWMTEMAVENLVAGLFGEPVPNEATAGR